MTAFSRTAPAKLNLTLEILGRRADGYHELRSVVTTLSLADEVSVRLGEGFSVRAGPGFDLERMAFEPGEINTVERALSLLRAFVAENRPGSGEQGSNSRWSLQEVATTLTKRIPAAAGLGGGSSDAVATLALLNDVCETGLNSAAMGELAGQIGSDCPFFVRGGVQVMRGRGEHLQTLPGYKEAWFCIVTPSIYLPNKTAALYSRLGPADYSDGSRTATLAARLQSSHGYQIQPEDLCNRFDDHADEAFGSLAEIRADLRATGALAVHLCGSGPSVYGLYPGEEASVDAAKALRAGGRAAWAVSAPV